MLLSRSTTSSTLSVSNRLPSTRSHTSPISKVWSSHAICQAFCTHLRLGWLATDTLTAYMKKVKEAMKSKGASDEDVSAFEKGAASYAKKIVGNFKDYDFYVGESMDPDGMFVTTDMPPSCTSQQLIHVQGRPYELPRGWNHSIRDCLEARSYRDEGLSHIANNINGVRNLPSPPLLFTT